MITIRGRVKRVEIHLSIVLVIWGTLNCVSRCIIEFLVELFIASCG